MKKLIQAFIFLLPAACLGQNIFTVSNIPGITAKYRTLQGAIDSVPDGSTIIVFPSATNYGNIVINKKLALYGNGFFLAENAEPNTASNAATASVASIWIKEGGSGSIIEGLVIASQTSGRTNFGVLQMDSTANVTISRCFFNNYNDLGEWYIQPAKTINCTIRNCYFDQVRLTPAGGNLQFIREAGNAGNTHTSSRGLKFIGNIINAHQGALIMFTGFNGQPSASSDISFINNTIIAGIPSASSSYAGVFCDYTYINNIFYITAPASSYNKNSIYNFQKTVANNVCNITGLFPARGKNLEGVALASLFSNATPSTDGQWKLTALSPAIIYATDGGQAGAFGGEYPYVLSGIPDLPMIYDMQITRDVANPGNVKVRIKGKSTY